jgi:hypothetical protein
MVTLPPWLLQAPFLRPPQALTTTTGSPLPERLVSAAVIVFELEMSPEEYEDFLSVIGELMSRPSS